MNLWSTFYKNLQIYLYIKNNQLSHRDIWNNTKITVVLKQNYDEVCLQRHSLVVRHITYRWNLFLRIWRWTKRLFPELTLQRGSWYYVTNKINKCIILNVVSSKKIKEINSGKVYKWQIWPRMEQCRKWAFPRAWRGDPPGEGGEGEARTRESLWGPRRRPEWPGKREEDGRERGQSWRGWGSQPVAFCLLF